VKRASMTKSSVPSEFRISETWDKCIESALIKTSLGLIIGSAAGIVLFRGPMARGLFAGSFTGFGFGLAWNDCNVAFKKAGLTQFPKLPARTPEEPSPKTEESSHSHKEVASHAHEQDAKKSH